MLLLESISSIYFSVCKQRIGCLGKFYKCGKCWWQDMPDHKIQMSAGVFHEGSKGNYGGPCNHKLVHKKHWDNKCLDSRRLYDNSMG